MYFPVKSSGDGPPSKKSKIVLDDPDLIKQSNKAAAPPASSSKIDVQAILKGTNPLKWTVQQVIKNNPLIFVVKM